MTGSSAICKEIVLGYRMAERPNEEANSQSPQLDEEDLHKVVGNGGNNACGSSMAGGEVNVNEGNLSSSSETSSVKLLHNKF